MKLLQTFKDVTFLVSKREEFNKDFVTFVPKPSWRGIEKNLKFMTQAGHGVQSEGEKIIAGVDYNDKYVQCPHCGAVFSRSFLSHKASVFKV